MSNPVGGQIPHPLSHLIKAWADGATIEGRPRNSNQEWSVCRTPSWRYGWQYRVQPVIEVTVRYTGWDSMHCSSTYTQDPRTQAGFDPKHYSRGLVKLTFLNEGLVTAEIQHA